MIVFQKNQSRLQSLADGCSRSFVATPLFWLRHGSRTCIWSVDRNIAVTRRLIDTVRFAAVGKPDVAVCLLPGTELMFEKDIHYSHHFSLLRFGVGYRSARFRPLNIDHSHDENDVLEFSDGGFGAGRWSDRDCGASTAFNATSMITMTVKLDDVVYDHR
jgi:hypothetical protein